MSEQAQNFYEQITPFSDFSQLTEETHFRALPDDWHIFLTDVVNSTIAIEEGKYRSVNTIGAASISNVLEVMDEDFPFVFGGDGVTLMVPPHAYTNVASALCSLADLSEKEFELNLRVGSMTAKEVYDAGSQIDIAKHELSSGQCIAFCRGGGLGYAESKIKEQIEDYRVQTEQAEPTEITGLSCRWNPIPNKNGMVLSILVESRPKNSPERYKEIVDVFDEIFDGQLEQANPLHVDQMTLRKVKDVIAEEKKYHSKRPSLSYLKRLIQIHLVHFMITNKLLPQKLKTYMPTMRYHADFRKFDDMLRMVIDCNPEQAEAIKNELQARFQKDEIFYGIHCSDESMMTCYVPSINPGEHIHFIDGADGGYAKAAIGMKEQIKATTLAHV